MPVKHCDKCRQFANINNQLPHELVPISSPFLFHVWGLDIVEPLPLTVEKEEVVIRETNNIAKWVEAVSSCHITQNDI